MRSRLVEEDSKNDDDENNGQDEQKNASLAPGALLVVARLLEVDVGATRGVVGNLYVLVNHVELGALLVNHVGDIAEQLVELADRLLNVADL
jgi:hypothetical protein